MDWHFPRPHGSGSVAGVIVAVLALQVISRWLQGFVPWQILPSTATGTWYLLSVQDTALSWIWPSAFLILRRTRGDAARAWLLLTVFAIIARGIPEVCLWEAGVYTVEERVVTGLANWYEALAKDLLVCAMALLSARRTLLLPAMVVISSLRIFV